MSTKQVKKKKVKKTTPINKKKRTPFIFLLSVFAIALITICYLIIYTKFIDDKNNKDIVIKNNEKIDLLNSKTDFYHDNIILKEIPKNDLSNDKISTNDIEVKHPDVSADNIIPDKKQNTITELIKENHSTENKNHERVKEYTKIAIVLDDVGYKNYTISKYIKSKIPITFALIPDLSDSLYYYNLLKKNNKDVILHIPMQPENYEKQEKNTILTQMSTEQVETIIDGYLNEYPDIIGANNHMGSLATQNERIMNIVFKELNKRNKFFLDSLTTSKSVTKLIKNNYNIDFFERDIFLDNEKDITSIKKEFNNLIRISRVKGFAIGIGHVQTANLLSVINYYNSKKDELKIEFVNLEVSKTVKK